MHKLSIGSGGVRESGWLNLDANEQHKPDFVAKVPPLPPEVRCIEWDEVQMIHMLSMLYPRQAIELLREIRGALVPGGLLIIEQPDISYCARVLLGEEKVPPDKLHQMGYWGFFGDPSHEDPYYTQHWGYTPKTLGEAVIAAGFAPERISLHKARHHVRQRDFRLEVTR